MHFSSLSFHCFCQESNALAGFRRKVLKDWAAMWIKSEPKKPQAMWCHRLNGQHDKKTIGFVLFPRWAFCLTLVSLCRRSLSHCNELLFPCIKSRMQSQSHPSAVAFVSTKCLCRWRAKAWITSQFFSSVELEWPREWFLLHFETSHCFSVQGSFCHTGLDCVMDMGIWVLHFINFCHSCSNFSSFVSTALSQG